MQSVLRVYFLSVENYQTTEKKYLSQRLLLLLRSKKRLLFASILFFPSFLCTPFLWASVWVLAIAKIKLGEQRKEEHLGNDFAGLQNVQRSVEGVRLSLDLG
jgi:hypothetical protein